MTNDAPPMSEIGLETLHLNVSANLNGEAGPRFNRMLMCIIEETLRQATRPENKSLLSDLTEADSDDARRLILASYTQNGALGEVGRFFLQSQRLADG